MKTNPLPNISPAVCLYRGVDTLLPPEGLHQYIRDDRVPRNTGSHPAFNIAFNLLMELQFGVRRMRRCSLFVTGSIEMARRFAKDQSMDYVARVEPAGEFRFVWCPSVNDSKSLAERFQAEYLDTLHPWEVDVRPDLVTNIDLTWNDIDEISNYLAERRPYWSELRLSDRLRSRLPSLTSRSEESASSYQDSDLADALASGNEVLLFDCPKGYWLKPVRLKRMLDGGHDSHTT